MILAVMQPTYLPWAGYFNLIHRADVFVFLDNVQFSAQSWQQRNRVVLHGRPHWLTVPVHRSGAAEQQIREVRTAESSPWRRKHIGTLRQAYAKHGYGAEIIAMLEEILSRPEDHLAELNIALIRSLCRVVGIGADFHLSSDLPGSGGRSTYLLELCRHFGADTYLSPVGSREYIEQEGVFAASDVKVSYQNYVPAPYLQPGVKEFISHMSIVDVLAMLGFEKGREYVEQAGE